MNTQSWHAADTGNHQGLIIDDETGRNVAVVYDKNDSTLISQAPELLRSLKDAYEHLGYLAPEKFDDDEHKGNWINFMQQLQLTIYRAENP
jgi:hypothetical protein